MQRTATWKAESRFGARLGPAQCAGKSRLRPCWRMDTQDSLASKHTGRVRRATNSKLAGFAAGTFGDSLLLEPRLIAQVPAGNQVVHYIIPDGICQRRDLPFIPERPELIDIGTGKVLIF